MTGELEQVAELVRRESGISVRASQRRALETAIARVVPGEDAAGFLRLVGEPGAGPRLMQRLLDEVTVKETSFLRNLRELETIDWEGLTAGGVVRVWVAGCATGEEAYSLVLLAVESLGTAEPPLDVLATDVSEAALEAARAGRYRARSVADVGARLRERYFTEDDGVWLPVDSLRRPVRFHRHNLVRDPSPPLGEGRFDLVVCRNVLIYFDADVVASVIGTLEGAVKPSGVLLLGAADALHGGTRLRDTGSGRAGRRSRQNPDELLADALVAADAGREADALAATSAVLAEDPLNAEAYLVRGLVQLAVGESSDAAGSLRRALYIDPRLSVASFVLGRAYDALGEPREAARAYERALLTLDPEDERHDAILRQVDLGDIAAACRARIAALR